MNITSIEDLFEYQVKQVLEKLHAQYKQEGSELPFNEWLWVNAADFGKAMYERVDEYIGMDTLIQEIEP